MATDSPPTVHKLKVTIRDIEPTIWRQLLVPSGATLGDLHRYLQAAFGWSDIHLHEFRFGDTTYGIDDGEDWGRSLTDECSVTLAEVTPTKASFSYTYDFGDDWEHEVVVEAIEEAAPSSTYPRCLAGRRAAPPEDCGGYPGYYHLVEALGDSQHPDHADLLEWIGGDFDADSFDVGDVNDELSIQGKSIL